MTLAMDTPNRDDRSFRDNDDQVIDGCWVGSVITGLVVALRFEATTVTDPETGLPVTVPDVVHTISATTPDPDGWVDPSGWQSGRIWVMVPHTIWSQYESRRGVWDLVAVAGGVQTCLSRGRFVVETGVATVTVAP